MATVYITKELKARVSSSILQKRKREIANDLRGHDLTRRADAHYIYNLGCWGAKHMHLVNVIPKDWLRREKGVTVTVNYVENDVSRSFNIGFESDKFFSARPATDYWNRVVCIIDLDVVLALPEETIGRAEIIERWEQDKVLSGINSRWAKIETDIMAFLDKCKSLNEAVKLLPNITMYLADEDIERLNRKVERATQRKAIVADVDVESITAAAIADKLSAAL